MAAAALLITAAETARLFRNEKRHPSRNYLTRLDLPPNPRFGTAWTHLFDSQNDHVFITTMGFDVRTFNFIIDSGFGERWHHTPIPREDTRSLGNPRPGGRSLDVSGALGLVLHYLNSTMMEFSLQQIFRLIPSTVSRYITFGLDILLEILRHIPDSKIQWPRARKQYKTYTKLITARHPRLHGAFATIDGLNLMVETADDVDMENATYNGWLSEHFVSSVIVFAPDGTKFKCAKCQ